MPSLLEKTPNLLRLLTSVSDETREAIVSELVSIWDEGRASAYERAIKVVGPSRRARSARAEFQARMAACRRER